MKFLLGCMVTILIFNIVFGGILVEYTLEYWSGRDIPFWKCGLIGILGGELAVPAALITIVYKTVTGEETRIPATEKS